MANRRAMAAGVAIACCLWVIALVPAYQFFTWPRQIDTMSLVGVVRIAGILGLVAGVTRIPSAAARLVLAAAVMWALWCPLTAWPALVGRLIAGITGSAACPVGICAQCATLLPAGRPGWPDLALVVVATALAVWRRPAVRRADGTLDRGVNAVRWLGVACLLGGPVAGVAGWLVFAPGDIYGGPLGLGVLVGLFGLVTLTAHAAFDGLLGSVGRTNLLAPAYAAVAIMAPVLFAAAAGRLRLG